MKYPIVILIAALLTSCSSLTAMQQGIADSSSDQTPGSDISRAGTTLPVNGTGYPAVAVTSDGGHAIVMPPCGNTSVVVNPDGTHSIAVINGMTATIVTP